MNDAEKNYDAAKKAFMDAMNEELVKEFGFDLKTMMLFADAISRVKTSREKKLEAELEQAKKDQYDAVRDRMMAEQKFNEFYKRAEAAESRVKELEFNRPVQVDGDVFELAVKLAEVTAERDKAISDFHKAVKENGICSSCKHRFKECAGICMCDADGEDHWEWEGLNG